MRGKNILWLSLIAMFLCTMMVTGDAPRPPRQPELYIDPRRVPEGWGALGHPGDEYFMSVKIRNVENLWSIGFKIDIAPFVSVLTASDMAEGDFLSENGTWPTFAVTYFHVLDGTIGVAITRIIQNDQVVGVSGDGTIMTFKLTVLEAGVSPIDIKDSILIDADGLDIEHRTRGGKYYGTIADLRWMWFNITQERDRWGRRRWHRWRRKRATVTAGDTFYLESAVVNKGDLPLKVRVRYDIDRIEDGRRIVIRSGQTYGGGGFGEPLPYEYVYLDEFNEWYYEWKNDPLNALGTPDDLFIEGDANAQWACLYGFEDITLGAREIADIELEGYSQYPNGATEAVDIDVYGFSSVQSFAWLGSNYGTDAWGWHGVRWTADSVLDVMPELADETELNDMQILIYNYHGDAPDVIRVDSMRLKVSFASITPVIPPEYDLLPGERLELDPVTWPSTEDHIGHYTVTATVEYTAEGEHWNSWGARQITRVLRIVPPRE